MNYPAEVTSPWLAKYIMELQYQGLNLGEGHLQWTEKLLAPATKYKLVNLPIDSLRYEWPSDETLAAGEQHLSDSYAKMKTPIPPIVVTDDNYVIDGSHRVVAAKIRGDKTIPAYVPDMGKTASYITIPLGRIRFPNIKIAISVPELVAQTNAFSVKRRPGCNASLLDSNPKQLFLRYNVKCRESYSDPDGHTVTVKFDVDKVEHTQNANDLDVQLNCSCPAFLYWGAQWNLHQRDGLLGEPRPELVAPTKRMDLRGNFVICKHCKAVLERILPSVQHNIQNIIREKEVAKNKEQLKKEPTKLEQRQNEMKKRQEMKKLRDTKNKDVQKKLLDALRQREQEEAPPEDEEVVGRNAPAVVDTPKKEDVTKEEPGGSEDLTGLLENEEHKMREQEHKKLKDTPHLHKGLPYETSDEKEQHGHNVPSDDDLISTLNKTRENVENTTKKMKDFMDSGDLKKFVDEKKKQRKQTSLEMQILAAIAEAE